MPSTLSDFVSNATTASNESVPGAAFPVISGRTYWCRFQVPVTVAATTTGVELALDLPAASTVLGITSHIPSSTTAESMGTGTDDSGRVNADTAVAAGTLGTVEGMFVAGADGSCQLRVDTDAAAAVTVKKGAFVEYRDLGA